MIRMLARFICIFVVLFLLYVASLPDEFRITRSRTFAAPPEEIFSHINDLHRWKEWSPWSRIDPHASETFAGPLEGVGSSMRWSGNGEVGEGTVTIIESRPFSSIQLQLDFLRPFTASNVAEFSFLIREDQTVVIWSMFGSNSYFMKIMSVLLNCDEMVGSQFDLGLQQLSEIVER